MRFDFSRVAAAAVTVAAIASLNCGVALAAHHKAEGVNGDPAALAFDTAKVGNFGGEPSITATNAGKIFETSLAGGTATWKSLDGGEHWTPTKEEADPSSGDDCLSNDASGAVYLCNLAGSQETHPLEADAWKTVDDGNSWTYGENPFNAPFEQNGAGNLCGTSCNPFGVDRPWMDSWIPPGGDTNSAEVLMMYHDFYGPSHIWVNVSHDGGKTYGQSQDVLANLVPGSASSEALAATYLGCSSDPAGAGIAKSGPHAGRMYVGWMASDPESFATGCNVSSQQAFHTFWIAYSDDNGATWVPQMAYDAGAGHDASTLWSAFTLDDQGNPYFAFPMPGPGANPAVCAAESAAGTLQSDTSCTSHMWVVWSKDGGQTFDGGGGLIPGSAATAYEVDPSNVAQTDTFPAIAAGDPGHVTVAWLHTNETEPTMPNGKLAPGGCAGSSTAHVPTYPDACPWNLYAAQSLNLYAPAANVTWTSTQITHTPMHVGDICNLGIACIPGVSDRNLADFISATVDPSTGRTHISYADDNKLNKTMVANQISGPSLYAAGRLSRTRH